MELAGSRREEKGRSGKIGRLKDINRDGFDDLIVNFLVSGLELEELEPDATEAELAGPLLDGTEIFGTDSIRLVGRSGHSEDLTLVPDQHMPDPATIGLFPLGGCPALLRRWRRGSRTMNDEQ